MGVVLIIGCGATTNGTKQKVSIYTNTGQKVIARVNGEKITIPAKDIKISRTEGAYIQVLHEDNPCFEDTHYSIVGRGNVSKAFWLNSFLGSTIDAVSGGMWEFHDPNFIMPINQIPNCKTKTLQGDSRKLDSNS